MSSINIVFDSYFNAIDEELTEEEVRAGENGTGYFDGLTTLSGERFKKDRAKFIDRHGRKGIVLFTNLGNVVLFERYINDDVFVSNAVSAFRDVVAEGSLDKQSLEWLLNCVPDNRPQCIVNDILDAAKVRGLV